MVKIYFLNVSTLDTDVLASSKYISDIELSELSKYKAKEAREEKLASTYLKNKYIGEYRVGERGKPLSDKMYFNVSHSHGFVALAIGEDSHIGIDIEKIRPIKEDLKKFVSSEEEFALAKDDSTFFEIWTSKEALLKAMGNGIDRRLPSVPGLPLNGMRELDGERFLSKTFHYEDYVITVTVMGEKPFEIEMIKEIVKS
ncbi:MAG: 4'-phosphopantetheinyl transferase superfamily protein [Bacilli bacterium]|nr:4'-phosphopantetheinyl transferase superfamily protein [Bacilli bacterium]